MARSWIRIIHNCMQGFRNAQTERSRKKKRRNQERSEENKAKVRYARKPQKTVASGGELLHQQAESKKTKWKNDQAESRKGKKQNHGKENAETKAGRNQFRDRQKSKGGGERAAAKESKNHQTVRNRDGTFGYLFGGGDHRYHRLLIST